MTTIYNASFATRTTTRQILDFKMYVGLPVDQLLPVPSPHKERYSEDARYREIEITRMINIRN